jgi:sulfoxide reductase heme-binding subunit YedZ
MTMVAATTGTHIFWIASRAAGILALLLASASVGIGLLQSGRTRLRVPELRSVHEALSIATMAAIAFHGLVLLGDGYMNPSLTDLLVPFAGSYRPVWTAIGICSGWAIIVLGLSYYFRRRIGVARWRTLHRFTALAWLGGLIHSLGEGTDAGQAWFLVAVSFAVLPPLFLLVARYLERAEVNEPSMRGTT